MRIKLSITSLVLSLLLGFFFPRSAFAASYTLSGHIQNSTGTAIDGATVDVKDASTNTVVTSTTTNSTGDYSVSIDTGTYNIQVTPPSGSGLTSAVALNQAVSSNKTVNFILTPTGSAILSGYVYDPSGVGLPDQKVLLQSGSILVQATTDSNGFFSMQANTGTYTLKVTYPDAGNTPPTKAPGRYTLTVPNYSLSQSTIINFTPPSKKVDIHVQDANGNPVSNTKLQIPTVTISGLSIGSNLTASGSDDYGVGGFPQPQTNASGDATLWLFPNTSSTPYSITATPPTGSHAGIKTVTNVVFSSDTSLNISLPPTYTLSGHVIDSQNNALSDQHVILKVGSTTTTATTDNTGYYTLEAVAGTYTLQATYPDTGNMPPVAAPGRYTLNVTNYSFTQDTTQNITIPAKQVSLHVQDAAGNAVSNVQVQVPTINVSNQTVATGLVASGNNDYGVGGFAKPQTDSSGNVNLWLFTNTSSTPYSFIFTPPSGSNLASTTVSNVVITGDTSRTVTMNQPVTLSGHVYDPTGAGLSGQHVTLQAGSTLIQTTTSSTGAYSLNANAGTYSLQISYPDTGNLPPTKAPGRYTLTVPSYQLLQTSTADITIPAQQVNVHVQDSNGNPVGNVQLQIPSVSMNGLNIGSNLIANGGNDYGIGGFQKPQTDTNGDVTLWLFANSSSNPYSITAIPPTGSIFSQFVLNNIVVVPGTQTEIISLQYNHAAPVTTASFATDRGDGTYTDPTTVTLAASASSGYTVANTYYKVDNGAQQTYTAPFTVIGAGAHTISYWSVDNSGAQEQHHFQSFTIVTTHNLAGTVYVDANQNGFQDTGENGYQGAVVTLDNSQTATTDANGNYTFNNLPEGTYVETLTLPNGYTATTTNPATVALGADSTQNFGISSGPTFVTAINAGGNTDGNFVADAGYSGGSVYTTSTNADTTGVDNPAPQSVYKSVRYGNFSYTVSNLTPNSAYTLRLHFNELYWNNAGARVFNVSANGTQVLSNYDIYTAAGGKDKGIVEQVPATTDANGNVTLQFTTVTDNAMVNGIEVYAGTLSSPSPTATPTPVSYVAVNAGGGDYGNFRLDNGYNGGSGYSTSSSVDTDGVTNPAPTSVYQTVRYGNFSYTLAHLYPNANYTVRLHFNELYWSSAGQRVFNVSINGSQVLSNYDIYTAAGGANKAVVEEFTEAANSNGQMNLQFSTVTDNAMVNGIELIKQ